MLNGFLSMLSLRRQAYTGKPSSSIRYVNGRYIIEGEVESEDEAPPPPPPAKRKETAPPVEEPKEQPKEISGDGLTKVAFGGAFANRGRGRGRGGSRPTFAATPGLTLSKPPI